MINNFHTRLTERWRRESAIEIQNDFPRLRLIRHEFPRVTVFNRLCASIIYLISSQRKPNCVSFCVVSFSRFSVAFLLSSSTTPQTQCVLIHFIFPVNCEENFSIYRACISRNSRICNVSFTFTIHFSRGASNRERERVRSMWERANVR